MSPLTSVSKVNDSLPYRQIRIRQQDRSCRRRTRREHLLTRILPVDAGIFLFQVRILAARSTRAPCNGDIFQKVSHVSRSCLHPRGSRARTYLISLSRPSLNSLLRDRTDYFAKRNQAVSQEPVPAERSLASAFLGNLFVSRE